METYNSIEVAKQLVKDGKISQEIAETIFPELKESEDERIRKGIIQSINDLNTEWLEIHRVTKKDAIAWLEKQGSQNLANSAKTCKDEQNPAWNEEDEEMFGYLEDIVNFCYCNQYVVNVQTCEKVRQLVFRLKSLCFQSGWRKDDITRINEIIETLNIVQANRVHTQRMHYNKATIDKNIDWLTALKERHTWKPSDEQIISLDTAIARCIIGDKTKKGS